MRAFLHPHCYWISKSETSNTGHRSMEQQQYCVCPPEVKWARLVPLVVWITSFQFKNLVDYIWLFKFRSHDFSVVAKEAKKLTVKLFIIYFYCRKWASKTLGEAGEMAQLIKASTVKSDDLSSVPRTLRSQEEYWFLWVIFSTSTRVLWQSLLK